MDEQLVTLCECERCGEVVRASRHTPEECLNARLKALQPTAAPGGDEPTITV